MRATRLVSTFDTFILFKRPRLVAMWGQPDELADLVAEFEANNAGAASTVDPDEVEAGVMLDQMARGLFTASGPDQEEAGAAASTVDTRASAANDDTLNLATAPAPAEAPAASDFAPAPSPPSGPGASYLRGRSVGIDLGTTNSAIACVGSDGTPSIIELGEGGARTMASTVRYYGDGKVRQLRPSLGWGLGGGLAMGWGWGGVAVGMCKCGFV